MHRLPLTPLVTGAFVLPDAAARYLVRVLRLREGDGFEAFDPRAGVVAKGAVLSIDRDVVRVILDDVSPVSLGEPALVLVQGYPKGDKLGDIVRDATELGATIIVPAIAARSVARPDEKKAVTRAERLSTIADEAARQCGRTRAPTILAPMPWSDAVATAKGLATRGAVLWEEATAPLGDELASLTAHAREGVAFFIGPEGGLERDEVVQAEAAGFPARSLGKVVLRTETAATAVLGAFRVMASSRAGKPPTP
jgi:16S rRNA (uracil1498-N3)-methyltransferase